MTAASPNLTGVVRGGALNMLGAVVWGASNFILLAVITRSLGAESAGVVILGIAMFNILTTVAGLGCSSGLVRHLSRFRATGSTELMPATLVIALVPVAVVGLVVGALVYAFADNFASLFSASSMGGAAAELARTLRWMAPFMPVVALYWVIIQGTRGFDTMRPVVLIDKVGRGVLLPLVVFVAVLLDLSPAGVGAMWAATTAVALLPAAITMRALVREAMRDDRSPADDAATFTGLATEYWRFTGPRAIGQVSEVTVNWLDTVIVGSILGAAAAGVYGAGTRYVLPGLFLADAIMQVVGPRISGLLSSGAHDEAEHMLTVATGWQVMVLWPIYLLIAVFAPTLLGVFGPEVTEATGALRWLSVGILISALAGPAASVILMSGRSVLAMANTMVLLAVNVVGNLVLVPRHGIAAAGAVWGLTLIVASFLPAFQAWRGMDLATFGHPARVAARLALPAFLPAALGSNAALGQGWLSLAAAGIIGMAIYTGAITRWGGGLELGVLRTAIGTKART